MSNASMVMGRLSEPDPAWLCEDHVPAGACQRSISTSCEDVSQAASGMVWTRIGDIPVASIDAGGLAQDTGDWVDVAFAGWLELYADIAAGDVDYYQVTAATWSAPACRGGRRPHPGAGRLIGATLWQKVWIFDPATLATTAHDVKMGPFSAGGVENLYATQAARQTLPAPPGLEPFPPMPKDGEVFWSNEGLALATCGGSLLGGIPFGTVDVTLAGYDAAFAPVGRAPNTPLTLTIDETPITRVSIDGCTAWRSPGVPAPLSGACGRTVHECGPAGFVEVAVTVRDTTGFLHGYELEVRTADGNVTVVTPPGVRGTAGNPLVTGPDNPDAATGSWTGGTETIVFTGNAPDGDTVFHLYAGKRVTDGYAWPSLGEADGATLTLKFSA